MPVEKLGGARSLKTSWPIKPGGNISQFLPPAIFHNQAECIAKHTTQCKIDTTK